MKIWTLITHRHGEIDDVSYEVLSAARRVADELNGRVTAVVIGHDELSLVARKLYGKGADEILVVRNEKAEIYPTDVYLNALYTLIDMYSPDILLMGQTPLTLTFAPRLAVKLGVGLASNCIGLVIENDELIFRREICGGKIHEEISLIGSPKIALFLPGSFTQIEIEKTPLVKEESIQIEEQKLKTKVVGEIKLEMEGVDLSKAEIIVAGGRGLRTDENFKELIGSLAKLIGAEVAGSRPAMDYKWIPPSRLVGISGKTVKPKLYIAIGISGSSQHISGMRGSRCIIAINKDAHAPILKIADYGIIGDLFKIVPAIIDELRRIRREAS